MNGKSATSQTKGSLVFFNTGSLSVIAGLAATFSVATISPTHAQPLVINPQGDSITHGVETSPNPDPNPGISNDDSDGGYRNYLNELLTGSPGLLPSGFDSHRFLGGLDTNIFDGPTGSPTFAEQHYGVRGIEASAIGRGLFEGGDPTSGDNIPFSTNGPGTNSLADRVENRGSSTGFFPFNPSGATEFFVPDVVTVHIGTNTLLQVSNSYANPSDTIAQQATAVANEAAFQISDYLVTLDTEFDDISANDTRFLVAKTIPVVGDFWGGGVAAPGGAFTTGGLDADNNSIGEIQASFLYAEAVEDLVNTLPSDTADRVEIVDLFEILVADLDLAFLAATQGETEAEILAQIDVDGDPYVDWALGIDESDLASLTGVTGEGNLNLIGDGIHPTDLGYAIIANRYFDAITIPEPTSVILVMTGAALMIHRRQRRAIA